MTALLRAVFFAAGIAAVQVPGAPDEYQARQPGNRAVMTLEITSTAQFGWPTLDACREGVAKALAIAKPLASEGDHVEVQCFAVRSVPQARQPAPAPRVDGRLLGIRWNPGIGDRLMELQYPGSNVPPEGFDGVVDCIQEANQVLPPQPHHIELPGSRTIVPPPGELKPALVRKTCP